MTSRERTEARARLGAFFRDGLRAAEAEAPDYEDVEAYVDGTLEPEERELFELRLADDPLLQQEVQDLRELRRALVPAARLRGYLWPGLAAAAGLALVLWATFRRPGPSPEVAVAPTPSLSAAPGAVLQDGGQGIGLAADGRLAGLERLPAGTRDQVARALQTGVMPLPAELAALRGPAVTLMGAPGERARFEVTSPVGTMVRSARPTFRWRAHAGARAYQVSVYDEDLRRLAQSPELRESEWSPGQDLPRGRVLLWQVAALTSSGREAAPAPPEPEARFRILDAAFAAELSESLAAAAGSHLATAVVLARAGLVDEAKAELAALAARNPDAREPRRLQDSLGR
jgi:hypothetical protein